MAPTATPAHASIIVLALALAACSAQGTRHLEPQIAPEIAKAIVQSPVDPDLMLVVEYAGALSLWRVADLDAPERLSTIFTNAHTAAFSADGKSIVVAGRDRRLRLLAFDGRELAESAEADAGKTLAVGLAVDSAGERIITADGEGLWSWSPSNLSRTSIERNEQISNIAVSRDGVLAVGLRSGAITLKPRAGSERTLNGHAEAIRSMAFVAGSATLVSASQRSLRLWRLDKGDEGTVLGTLAGDESYEEVASDPSGKWFIARSYDDEDDEESSTISLWDARGRPVASRPSDPIRASAIARDGSGVVAVTGDALETARRTFTRTPFSQDGPRCHAADYSADGAHLAVACENRVSIVPGATPLTQAMAQPGGWTLQNVVILRFTPDGSRLIAVTKEPSISIYRIDAPQSPPKTIALTGDTTSLAVSNSLLALSSDKGEIRLWTLEGARIDRVIDSGEEESIIALEANGDLIASGASGGTVKLMTTEGTVKSTLATGLGDISALTLVSEQRLILAGDKQGSVVAITMDGAQRAAFKAADSRVTALALSKDGRLAVGSPEALAIHQMDGRLESAVRTSPGAVTALAFAPDGTHLVGTLFDDTWELAQWGPALNDAGSMPRPMATTTLSPAGDAIVSLARPPTIWRLTNGSTTALGDSTEGLIRLTYAPGGRFVAAHLSGGGARVWTGDGTQPRHVTMPGANVDPALSNVGLFAYADTQKGSELYLQKPDGSFETKTAAGKVASLVATTDGRWIAVRADGTMTFWNADGTQASHALAAEPPLKIKGAHSASVSSDTSRLAMVDRATGIWVRTEGDTIGPLQVSGSKETDVMSLTFFRGHAALAGIARSRLVWWNLDDPETMHEWHAGVAVNQIGAADEGLWASTSYGSLFLLDENLDIRARGVTTGDGGVMITRDGRYAGHGELYQRARLYSGDLTPLGEQDKARGFSQERVRATMMRQLGWWMVTRDAVIATWSTALLFYGGLPAWAKVSVWPTAAYVAMLATMLLMWVVVPGRVASLAMPSYTQMELPAWKLVTETLTLARWLGHTGRALDGWLTANREQQRLQGFAGKGAIQLRSVYVDLGNEADVAAWTRAVAAKTPAWLWITGPGGCGKSTLAFHLVRIVLESDMKRPIVPLVVDADWTGPLLDHIAEALRDGSRRPTLEMAQRLAHTGRLVLVLDGLSERGVEDARGQVLALTDKSVLRYLVVTARDEKPDRESIRQVTVGPLEGARLKDFVAAYAGERHEEALAAVEKLSKGLPIRPLFARIAVEWFLRGDALPGDYPALIQAYVRGLRPEGHGALREDDFLRAARLVAYAAVKETWTPRAVSREYVRGQLDAEPLKFMSESAQELSSAVIIDQLVSCGLLEQIVTLAAPEIRFAFDPVAEYLAAMHVMWLQRAGIPPSLPQPLPQTAFAEALSSIILT